MSVLAGIKVVEAASMILVPAAATMLADFGAEVIKVEPPEGDQNRYLHELPTMPDSDLPYSFVMDNRSKKGIVIDLKQPEARAILHRLVQQADVFMTNFRRAALERLDLTWEALAPLNPRLVYASASGFGEAGSEAWKPAYDTVVYWSRSGIESSLLTADGTLGHIPPGSGDHPSALALFGAVTLALFARERTGRGARVSTSLLAAGVWANATLLQAQLAGATLHPKLARAAARSFGAVYYTTRDGRMLKFALVNPAKLWPLFCRAVGRPELADDPRFAGADARRRHAGELIAILDAVFAERDAAHWKERFEAHDIPFAILPTQADVIADPQIAANGMILPLEHPRYGRLHTVDSPITVEGVPKMPPGPAPELGHHTTEVLMALGYSKDAVRDLLERGVVVQR